MKSFLIVSAVLFIWFFASGFIGLAGCAISGAAGGYSLWNNHEQDKRIKALEAQRSGDKPAESQAEDDTGQEERGR